MKQFLTLGMKCKYCGCDDYHACPGGCFWVEEELCSRCAEEVVKCKVCQHCSFQDGHGSLNKYYCCHPKNKKSVEGTAGATILCKPGRSSTKEFNRKRTPNWCPLK